MLQSLAVAIGLAFGADTASDAIKTETARFDGEWTMAGGERDGQPLPAEFLRQARRVCRNGETTVSFGDQVFVKARFTVDPGRKPKSIDCKFLEGPNTDTVILGIYELNGDVLKFCFTGPNDQRPTEFKTKEGSGWTLSEWKRAKKQRRRRSSTCRRATATTAGPKSMTATTIRSWRSKSRWSAPGAAISAA